MSHKKIKAGGREIEIRGLKRKEVKQLRQEHGIDLGNLRLAQAEEATDKVFEIVLSPEEIEFLDDQCNAEAVAVFRAIMNATYGREEEKKNS